MKYHQYNRSSLCTPGNSTRGLSPFRWRGEPLAVKRVCLIYAGTRMSQTDPDQFLDNLSTEASANRRARAQRVKWLLGYVNQYGLKWERKMLVARFSMEYGISPSTVYTYLTQLLDGEYVFLSHDHILSLDQYEGSLRKDFGITVSETGME